jgi:hypothetical protein
MPMQQHLKHHQVRIITDLNNEEINKGITLEGPRESPLGLEGSHECLDLSEANILSLSMSMSRDMSEKGRNWKIAQLFSEIRPNKTTGKLLATTY